MLLPGIDSLNHRRGEKVSWVVTLGVKESGVENNEPHISLVLNSGRLRAEEVFNNYGLKTNAELILGYGFAIPGNSDDRVVIKLGGKGASQKRHEIGRGLNGLGEVIEEMKDVLRGQVAMTRGEDEEEMEDWECELEVLEMLQELVTGLVAKMGACEARIDKTSESQNGIRKEVTEMAMDYIRGELLICHDHKRG